MAIFIKQYSNYFAKGDGKISYLPVCATSNKEMVHAWRASIELWMYAGSWESTREAFVSCFSSFSSALPTSQVHP